MSHYLRRKILCSEYLTLEKDLLRNVEEVEFIGTFVGDLKHYNKLEKKKREGAYDWDR